MPIYRGAGSTGTSSSVQSLADEAAASAAAAAASEAAASASATAAAASETAAAASETAADTSATDAGLAKDAAETAQAAAEAAYDSFDDRYLGAKASDPALDNDGNTLIVGAMYFNTTNGIMRICTSNSPVTWEDIGKSTANVTEFTASGGQTTFSGTDNNGVLLAYTVGFIMVYLNGVLLEDTTDYAATDGTSIVLTSGATAGDTLQSVGFGSFDVANTYTQAQCDAQYRAIDTQVENEQLIMNSQFYVWQRGATITGMTDGDFGPDRWVHARDGSGATVNCYRTSWTVGHASNTWNAPFYARFHNSVAGTGETYNNWQQRIEDVRKLSGKTVTLSMTVYSADGADHTMAEIRLKQSFGSGGSAAVDTSVATNVNISSSGWTTLEYTFDMPSISGKTVGANNFTAIVLEFGLNQTYDIYLSRVQLDIGSVAKDPPLLYYGDELARCWRYYERWESSSSYTYVPIGQGRVNSSSLGTLYCKMYPKRATPTISYSNLSDFILVNQSAANQVPTALAISNPDPNGGNFKINVSTAAVMTAKDQCWLEVNNVATAYIDFSAEL